MEIQTFIFFDLETTGLIRNTKMPRVTEIALVGVSRHALTANRRDKLSLPRVLHKLVLPVNPGCIIPYEVSNMTDLWNDGLAASKLFDDETFYLISQFIERLPPPVCFVAHNGKRFDYPIFLSELRRLHKVLPNEIMCIDTLDLFKYFLKIESQKPSVEPEIVDVPTDTVKVDQRATAVDDTVVVEDVLNDDWDDVLYKALDDFAMTNTKDDNILPLGLDETDKQMKEDSAGDLTLSRMQAVNETTPKSQTFALKDASESSKICLALKAENVKRRLNFEERKLKNYKLPSIYKYLIGCNPSNSHNAEDDCISMIRCVCQLGHDFAKWADDNKQPFNSFKMASSR